LWLVGTEDLNQPVKSGLCYLLEVKVSLGLVPLSFARYRIVVTYTSAYFVTTIIVIG
jgi:hypothetical protein